VRRAASRFEIEQLGRAVARDEDVRRLDVSVHHQALVRVLDRGAHLAEQGEARAEREPVLRAVRSIGSPSTYSTTTKATPSSAVPPSSRRAMFGWSSVARICRSRRRRRATRSAPAPARTTFTATRRSNAASSRSAR
jgi:hypothetical protein